MKSFLRSPRLCLPFFLSSFGLAISALALCPSASAASDSPAESHSLAEDLRVEQLAPEIWRHEFMIPLQTGPFPANGLIVASPEGALVIDTPWTEDQTRLLLDWIETELRLPLLGVVATHFHQDRVGGLALVHHRGVPTHGSSATAKLVDRERFEAPRSVFRKRKTLRVGEHRVELFYPGPGHTDDNIIAWLPSEKILFGGCLVKSAKSRGLGNLRDADTDRWPQSIRRLQRRYPSVKVVVPGHGTPSGPEALTNTLDLLEAHLQSQEKAP